MPVTLDFLLRQYQDALRQNIEEQAFLLTQFPRPPRPPRVVLRPNRRGPGLFRMIGESQIRNPWLDGPASDKWSD